MGIRTYVYIDGFNLYHALCALNQDHLKWLDLWKLSESLIRDKEELACVKYFTAYATWRQSSYRRHQRYIQALEHHGVTPIIGRFKRKSVRCQATCGATFWTHEEKETDVNIGAHLVADALKNRFDRALVISADTDLNAAVDLARAETGDKLIDLVAPPGRKGRNSRALFEITLGKIRRSTLPSHVTLQDGRVINRPTEYDPPA
ncbi:NYN domain-containing protein [Erythrobacter sp. HA6-11]